MENYKKGRQEEEIIDRNKISIPNLPDDFIWIQVADGSKMRNLLRFAEGAMKEKKQVVWTGVGKSLGKAISCAEILKRKFHAHQISRVCYAKMEEHWEPKNLPLEPLVVHRHIPVIHILVSTQDVDVTDLGYQGPGKKEVFWKETGTNKPPEKIPQRARPGAGRRAKTLKQLTSLSRHDTA